MLILVLFFSVIGVAKATGNWSVSGKLTASGERIAPTGADPTEIKGWMALGDIATAYAIPWEELLSAFDLPADTPKGTQIKSLEGDAFSPGALRTWLATRLSQ
jgi:hypothetical protein